MKLNFALLNTKNEGTLGTRGTSNVYAGLSVPKVFSDFGDNGDKTSMSVFCPQLSPVCPPAETDCNASIDAVSPMSPLFPAEKIESVAVDKNEETETAFYWSVLTSDRGTVPVTTSWLATPDEILDAVPGAVSAIALEERTS